MTDVATITSDLAYQLSGMTDDASGEEVKFYSLDIGEIFVKTPNDGCFKLLVYPATKDEVSLIDDDDWS